MEAFGVAASAIQLAEIAFRIGKSLAAFAHSAKTADAAALELRDKFDALGNTVSCVKSVIYFPEGRKNDRRLSKEEIRIRHKLLNDIKVCIRISEHFESALEGLSINTKHPSWLGKSLLQLRLDRKNDAIRRLENFLDARVQMLQVSIACLQVYVLMHMIHLLY